MPTIFLEFELEALQSASIVEDVVEVDSPLAEPVAEEDTKSNE